MNDDEDTDTTEPRVPVVVRLPTLQYYRMLRPREIVVWTDDYFDALIQVDVNTAKRGAVHA